MGAADKSYPEQSSDVQRVPGFQGFLSLGLWNFQVHGSAFLGSEVPQTSACRAFVVVCAKASPPTHRSFDLSKVRGF